jgi:anti-sigma B factor antagonist
MAEYHYNLRDDVDIATAPTVRSDLRAIIAGCDSHVRVDCAQLTFIDSTGIVVLLEAHRDLQALGREMLVTNVPPMCSKVFDILGLNDLMRWDRAEVVAAS